MIKIIYKPVSILVSVLGGILAGVIFKRIWKVATGKTKRPRHPTPTRLARGADCRCPAGSCLRPGQGGRGPGSRGGHAQADRRLAGRGYPLAMRPRPDPPAAPDRAPGGYARRRLPYSARMEYSWPPRPAFPLPARVTTSPMFTGTTGTCWRQAAICSKPSSTAAWQSPSPRHRASARPRGTATGAGVDVAAARACGSRLAWTPRPRWAGSHPTAVPSHGLGAVAALAAHRGACRQARAKRSGPKCPGSQPPGHGARAAGTC